LEDQYVKIVPYFCAQIKYLYTLAEGIMISVKSLQRSEGGVSDPIYMYILDQHY